MNKIKSKTFFLCVLLTALYYQNSAYPSWKKVIESAKPSVLMINIESLAKLENETPGCYQATGFIVDEKLGLILTNRHVIGASPSTTRVIFWNKEKTTVKPVWYDPIHDFGFLKFDPKSLRWTKPKALKLGDSSKVKTGEEIRVLGNNASEGFSILEGTISRVKKNAPTYSDPDTYRDSNTYYFQTSADVSGGSSGGPIINIKGEVLAINSSSKRYTTVSWGLPIDIVKRALEAIRGGKTIKRGDVGAKIVFSSFDEITDYGFPKGLISKLKSENKNIEGLLTVHDTIPATDAHRYLKPGDVIWQVAGVNIKDDFYVYESLLDSNVGNIIPIKVIREGKSLGFDIKVLDLEKVKLKSFVRIGYDYFTNIPISLTFSYNIPLGGVFTPSISYNFSERVDFPSFLVVTELGGEKLKTAEDFLGILKKSKNGDKLRIKYKVLKEDHREEEKVFKVNWKWFKPDYFKFDENRHEWIKVF